MLNVLSLFSHDPYSSSSWIYEVNPDDEVLYLGSSGRVERKNTPARVIQVPVVRRPHKEFPTLALTLLLEAWCRSIPVSEMYARKIVTLVPGIRLSVDAPDFMGRHSQDGEGHGLFLFLQNVNRVV